MKREDEEVCKARFDSFVRRFFTPTEVLWDEVPQDKEPPDYYLCLRNVKFAVEVTTLVEKVAVGTSRPLPPGVIRDILNKFVREVESVARGHLRGNYLVSFSRPIHDFAAVRDDIKKGLLEYIRCTAGLERAAQKVVFEKKVPPQRSQECAVKKVNSERNQVVMGGPMAFKWEGEIVQDVCWLLNYSLDTKAARLKAITEPWILLLLDRYVFADQSDYEKCVPQLAAVSSFHTVFVVQEQRGFILHSRDSCWTESRSK